MNRFKVLYVLNITVLLALMISVSASARNDNVLIKKGIKSLKSAKKMDLDNPPKLTGRIVKIAGLKFIELLQNKTKNRLYMCMDYEYPFFFKKTDHGYRKNGAKGTICFDSPVKDNEGLLHLMEHLLSNYTEKRGWFSLGSSNIVNGIGMNAYTYFLDEKNNVAEMELDLSEEFLYDENLIKKLSGALLGEADFIKNPEIFKDEKARVMLEQNGKRNLLEGGGTDDLIGIERKQILDRIKYDPAGFDEDVKNVSFDELKKFYYRYIVNANAVLCFEFKNFKDAEKSISLFKKHYLDKKKNFKLTETGKDKLKRDFVEYKISPEYAERTKKFEFFKEKEGNKKSAKTKNRIDVKFSIYDFEYYKKLCLSCINEDYFDNIKEIKDLKKKFGFEKIKFTKAADTYDLSIYTNNNEILKEEEIKRAVDEICEILIKHIDKKEIKLEDILSVRDMDMIKKQVEEQDYDFFKIINDINMSYILEGKPFSKKFFRFDKEGKLENNPEVFEEFFKENYQKVLKEILKTAKKNFFVYKRKEKKQTKKIGFSNHKNFYVPIKFNFKTSSGEKLDSALQAISEEIIAREVFNKKLKRLFYNSFCGNFEFNRFVFLIQSNLEIETLRKICREDLKKYIVSLDLTDSYIDEIIKTYRQILKLIEQKLELKKNSLEEQIKRQEELLTKKEISFEDVKNIQKKAVNLEVIYLAKYFLKLNYKEMIKERKDNEKYAQINSNLASQAREIHDNIKNDAKILDEKAMKIFKKQLKSDIEFDRFNLTSIKELLKKMKELINGQAKKITKRDVRECLKNVIVEDFDFVNKRERKRDEDLDKLIKEEYKTKKTKKNKN